MNQSLPFEKGSAGAACEQTRFVLFFSPWHEQRALQPFLPAAIYWSSLDDVAELHTTTQRGIYPSEFPPLLRISNNEVFYCVSAKILTTMVTIVSNCAGTVSNSTQFASELLGDLAPGQKAKASMSVRLVLRPAPILVVEMLGAVAPTGVEFPFFLTVR